MPVLHAPMGAEGVVAVVWVGSDMMRCIRLSNGWEGHERVGHMPLGRQQCDKRARQLNASERKAGHVGRRSEKRVLGGLEGQRNKWRVKTREQRRSVQCFCLRRWRDHYRVGHMSAEGSPNQKRTHQHIADEREAY